MGLVFVILAVGFFLDAIETWDAEVAWMAPVFLIAFGAAGVLSTVARGSRSEPPPRFDPAWAGPVSPPPEPPATEPPPLDPREPGRLPPPEPAPTEPPPPEPPPSEPPPPEPPTPEPEEVV